MAPKDKDHITMKSGIMYRFKCHRVDCYDEYIGENFSIVGREDQNLIRAIKEAIYIRVNNPSLNWNICKYHLPHIWDEVQINIPDLKLK